VPSDEKRRIAQLRLLARRRREGELRRRSIFLSLTVFAVLWIAVFAQMVSGHDPVLGTATNVAAGSKQSADRETKRSSANGSNGLRIDPETGLIVQAPTGSGTSSSATQPAPAPPAPVVTSQS
jgi:hypothetical protein